MYSDSGFGPRAMGKLNSFLKISSLGELHSSFLSSCRFRVWGFGLRIKQGSFIIRAVSVCLHRLKIKETQSDSQGTS